MFRRLIVLEMPDMIRASGCAKTADRPLPVFGLRRLQKRNGALEATAPERTDRTDNANQFCQPGWNIIGYTTVTIPPSGCGKLNP